MCGKNRGSLIAWIAIVTGALVLLGLLLPRWLWVLVCGCSLIAGGILLMCARR